MILHHGESLAYLKTLPDNCVDAVVTDPPYGLGNPPDPNDVLRSWLDTGHHEVKGGGFMGKEWDAFVPQPAFWREVYRVLKPGGHVAAFFGTRTYDWGTMAIRLAGFEIRTSLVWVTGSGFPKGNDISKAIDAGAVAVREVVGERHWAHRRPNPSGPQHGGVAYGEIKTDGTLTAPATAEAREWQGWNTQLKPAHEPICLARKPCSEGTVAANVLKWRTGALNIGACRVGTDGGVTRHTRKADGSGVGWHPESTGETTDNGGRYPATLIHDGSDAVMAEFPWMHGAGNKKPSWVTCASPNGHLSGLNSTFRNPNYHQNNGGSAARYFNSLPYEPGELESLVPFLYCAKASSSERNAGLTNEAVFAPTMGGGIGAVEHTPETARPKRNFHPTCKPIRLMEWLCNLLTPPGGTILDPFMGSGTTGIAAGRNGFDFIGCEMDKGYFDLCPQRIAHWTGHRPELPKVSNPGPLEPPKQTRASRPSFVQSSTHPTLFT